MAEFPDTAPLSPKRDQNQFSPNNINTQSNEKIARSNKKLSLKGSALIVHQILSTYSLRTCMSVKSWNIGDKITGEEKLG